MSLPDFLDDPRRACRDVPLQVFFPGPSDGAGLAREYCKACPFTAACRQYAVNNGDHHGVWGAVNFSSETERRLAHGQRDTNAIDPHVRDLHERGLSDAQIAHELGVVPLTVRRSRLRQQLPALFGPAGRLQAVAS